MKVRLKKQSGLSDAGKLFLLFLAAAFICSGIYIPSAKAGIYVTLSGPGAGPGDTILAGQPVTFDIHLQNFTGENILGMSHGFEIYSPDGATWAIPTYDTAGGLDAYFELGVFTTSASVTGSGADSIGVGAAAMFTGIPDFYDDVIFTITTQVSSAQAGKHLCIDSAFIPPSWTWTWSLSGSGAITPSWDGPKCYYIKDPNPTPCGVSVTISGPGAGTGDTILVNQPVTFDIHLRNCTGWNIIGFTNGFELYSPEGATWTVPIYDTTGGLDNYLDLIVTTFGTSVTGSGADSMGLGGANMFAAGIPDGFDDTVFTITTQVNSAQAGKHLCIDSAFIPPGYTWLWSLSGGGGAIVPAWNGPKCYYIKDPNAAPCGLSATISGPGAGTADTILSDQPVTFDVHLRNCTGYDITGLSNGFELYSPDGATWAVPVYDTTGGWDNYFDIVVLGGYSVNGSGADTMAVGAVNIVQSGFPNGFNDTVFTITTTVPGIHVGKHICIDSSFFPPSGTFLWSLNGGGVIIPPWNGPLCFYVKQGPIVERDTVVCEPQGGANPTHPSTYWYDVTPGNTNGICDFHVKVEDQYLIHYSNWVEPAGWSHYLHQVGSDWWVSWYNPGCTNPIILGNTFRFQFDNPYDNVWSEWRTTLSGTSDPSDQVSDSSHNHSAEPNGYGYLVHVPHFEMPEITEISLDTVINLWDFNRVPTLTPIRFVMGWTYMTNSGASIIGFQNGFRIYSPDGATWQPITYDTLNIGWPSIFDGGVLINPHSVTGAGADTVGFGGFSMFTGGMTAPFDQQVYWIETSLYPQDTGKHICIDSCWYPPGVDWLWSSTLLGSIKPDWDGPHCFEIVYDSSKCDCVPGEMNGDSVINIFDITGIIAYLYRNGDPPIPYELCSADMNGDCVVNIFDITGLISFLYLQGAPPVSCEGWLTNCDVPIRK
jgi:hypothetical protein